LGIKLIAMDLDGTLLDSRSRLPEGNVQAIAEAAASGIEIVIVTGRRFHSARSIADALPCDVSLIVSNGAVVKSVSGETRLQSLLPIATARLVLEATQAFRPYAGVIFDRPFEKQVMVEKIDWQGAFIGPYLSRHREQVAEIAPLTACLDAEDPVEVMFIGDCRTIRSAMQKLERHEHKDQYTLSLTEYLHLDFSMLDVLRRGVNKGATLSEWARHRGVAAENVMAIGDNWNDREMLNYAGLGIIMGNSVPELKSCGWTDTLSNDECGVAAAIRKHALNGTL
jgi:Cof subfamily protein (haloacid dehalogenase superfamily)